MWASLSLLLVILTLALSLRFYLSHCLPHCGSSPTALRNDWQGPRLGSENWNRASTSTPPASLSSNPDSKSLKKTQTT